MMELIYTSSSKGVDRGSQGYCTVACSDSIPPMLKMNLETMSDYSWIFPPHHKDFENNPVNYSFLKVKAGDEWLRVISRIGLNGLDYSGRPNKIAHFICLEDDDLDECHNFSPANIVGKPQTFVEKWDESSHFLEKDVSELGSNLSTPSCDYWQEVTGDAAWASHLVQKYHDSVDSQISVVYDSGIDPLKLIIEASALLSPEEQWDTTFSTYFNGASLNTSCNWRFILRDSRFYEGLKSTKNLIDLNDFKGQAPVSDLGMDDLSMDGLSSDSEVSQGDFAVRGGTGKTKKKRSRIKRSVNKSNKTKSGNPGITLLLIAIIALLLILLGKDLFLGDEAPDKTVDVKEEEVFYSYEIELEAIPEGDDLKELGDNLVRINTEKFLTELKVNKKMSLDIFEEQPAKFEITLAANKEYKLIDNVICHLFLEKIDGQFVQNKKPLLKLRLSKGLVVESVTEIDEDFIEEFKTYIKKMKVNRIIFEFI